MRRFITRNSALVPLMILIAVPVLASTRLMRITDNTYLITHQKQSGFGGQGKALRMTYEKAASLCVHLDFKWFEILDTQSKGRGFGSAAASTMKVKFFEEKPDSEEREFLNCKDLASEQQKVKMAKALTKMEAKRASTASAGFAAPGKPGHGDLFSAIKDGDYDQVANLISGDAGLGTKDEGGNSPLHIAVDRGRDRIAKLLVDKGADVNARNSEGITPLHEAAAMGDFQTTSLLVEAGADVKAKSDSGATPLHFAAEMKNFEMAQIVRSMGMPSKYNWKEDNLKVAELLIRSGADPNAQNDAGCTPLQRTTPWNYLPMAKLLMESGADPMLPDGDGLTPLDHAKDKGARDVATYLKKVPNSKN